ncbi:MAG: GyrI-like domain-containing protein [Oscillospiraceae bacterium]
MYGICIDVDEQSKDFLYWIADNYIPWQEIPTGCTAKVIPASTWAVFPCRGALPKALQEVNTRIWSEWLPNCKTYRLAGNYNVEICINFSRTLRTTIAKSNAVESFGMMVWHSIHLH